MFGLKTSGLLAFVTILSTGIGGKVESVFRSEDEANKSRNLTQGQYSVEYSDYMEVPSFKKHENGHFDYYNFMPGIDIAITNETNYRFAINKCCRWDYYFDVNDFRCSPLPKNLTTPRCLGEKIKNELNDSDYLFVENIPDCGNESVIVVQLTTKVSLSVNGVAIEGEDFPKYCIDGNPKRPLEIVALTCNDPLLYCKTHPCFQKCCPLGFSYVFSERKCQKSDSPFKPKFYNLTTLIPDNDVGLSQFGIYMGDACGTKKKYLLEKKLGEVSYLGVDGKLLVPNFDRQIFSSGEFCVEFVRGRNTSGVESFLYFSKTGTYFENSPLQFFLLSLGFIISCMFLLLTFLVYLFSPKFQNLYGKTLMCYIACLFSAYLCLAVVELKSTDIDKTVCTNLGYALLFSFLAAFFWLHVISFDIWKTFRLDRSLERSKIDQGKRRFLWYSLYAWSFPSGITAICAFVNQVQYDLFEVIKPNIGGEHCWFSRRANGIYVFFITPISLVIASNIFFYVQTAWKIWKVKSDINNLERQKKNKFSANKDQFLINGKLFIVMGITWSLEIISFFAPLPIWYITDAANALHGVFIFAVFVLKRKVLHQVSQQVRTPLKRMRQLTTSNSDDLSTRKNFQDLNTEGKSCATGASPRLETVLKSDSV